MSLLFEHAADGFSVDEASLYSATNSELAEAESGIPVRPIMEFASSHTSLTHPEEGWTCVPVHGPDNATPEEQYIGYTEHDVRGEIVLVKRAGDPEPIPLEEFGQTQLAKRVRFWHSDYLPETVPPGYDAPIADREPPRNPVEAEPLLDGLVEYVENERRAAKTEQRERARSQSPQTVAERGGTAVPELAYTGEDETGYHFRTPLESANFERYGEGDWAYVLEDEFGIHTGNEVLLHAAEGSAPDAFPVDATVERIRGRDVWLTVDWGTVENTAVVRAHLSPGTQFGLTHLLNPVPFDREREAIDSLREDAMQELIAGERPVTFANDAAARSQAFDGDLNQEQQQAVEYALLADDLFCIHGPPGTGKTRTLLEIVRRAVDAGESVLVCADSNQAVDNLVVGASSPGELDERSLHAYGQHGAGEFTLDRVNAERSNDPVVTEAYHEVADRATVVAATNSSAATVPREFDLLVLDEATQATCTASCIPLSRADRIVLAGDHRQLPPYSATESPPASSYGMSLFEHLYAKGGVYESVGLQLRTQYRMHRDIAHFPNHSFYGGDLRNGRVVESLPDRPPIEGYNIGGSVEIVEHSRRNEAEARLVTYLINRLTDDLPPSEIGVVTPYAAQVRLIRRTVAEHTAVAESVTVDTIDSFQGGERTAVVLSLVRSNADGDIGFLGRPEDGARRLNVALTRAKRYLAVVGDFHTLRYEHESKDEGLYEEFYEFFTETGRLQEVDPQFISL